MKTPTDGMPITVHFWLFIGVAFAVVASVSCFTDLGLFGLSCKASLFGLSGWVVISGIAIVAMVGLMRLPDGMTTPKE